MDHRDAQRLEAPERYFLGELPPEQRDAFEAHYFDCAECASEVRSLATLLEGARERLAASPPRLRSFRWWPLAAAAAVVLALGGAAYQAAVVVPRLQAQVDGYRSLRQVPSFFLSVSRAEPQTVSLSRQDREVVLALSRSSIQSFESYDCELRDGDGKAVTRSQLPAPPDADELQVLLPTAGLSPGPYVLRLAGVEAGSVAAPIEVARYHFVVRFEDEEVRR